VTPATASTRRSAADFAIPSRKAIEPTENVDAAATTPEPTRETQMTWSCGQSFATFAAPFRREEGAPHEEQVGQPEEQPRGPDEIQADREEDQARSLEEAGGSQQPETVASARVGGALGIVDPVGKRRAVVMEGREHQRERRDAHHDERELEERGIGLAAHVPGIQEDHREGEVRERHRAEGVRAVDVGSPQYRRRAARPPAPPLALFWRPRTDSKEWENTEDPLAWYAAG
jgi:hypothetical protein